jgi:hypothetical protein
MAGCGRRGEASQGQVSSGLAITAGEAGLGGVRRGEDWQAWRGPSRYGAAQYGTERQAFMFKQKEKS